MLIDSKEKLISVIKTCSLILFDFDGTLFDLHISWENIQQYIYNHFKKEYNEEIPFFNRFYTMFEFIEEKKGKEVKKFYFRYLQNQELEAVKEKKFSSTWLANQGINQIDELIRYDTMYGIVSSNFHDTVLEVLSYYEMIDKFQVIIGRDDVENAKPNPEGINQIISAYNLSRDKILFIGDTIVDEEAAQNAQINFIYVEKLQNFLE
ncbi:MAG: HAD family hydrolase [Promethearchaeota archaeon]